MNVILLEKVRNLGALGEMVHVKPGYARNYLIPAHKAVYATEQNVALFETRRAELEKKAQTLFEEAQKRSAQLSALVLTISAQASEEGKLYGSIGVSDIRDALKAKSVEVSKREIMMPNGPIYAVGHHEIEIILHSDVVAFLKVDVVAEK